MVKCPKCKGNKTFRKNVEIVGIIFEIPPGGMAYYDEACSMCGGLGFVHDIDKEGNYMTDEEFEKKYRMARIGSI